MRTLRIAVASRIFEPESGAAAYRLSAMVKELRARGHDVRVMTSRAPGATRSTPEVRRWPVLRDKSGAVRGYVQYASFDIPLFFRLLFGRRNHLIIVEPPPTTGVVVRLISGLRQTPYAYFAADVSSVAAEGIGVPRPVVTVLRILEGWVLSGAHTIFTVSEGVSKAVIQLGADPKNTVCVGTGIDTQQFIAEGPSAHGGDYFVYAGTMSEIQGAGVFIDAFLQIAGDFPDVRLFMYGQGVEFEDLKRRAQPLGDQVQFLGTVNSGTLSAVLRGATAGLASVRPSRGYDFAYATKAFASLSCGSPVIYAGVGPMKDLVEEESLGYAVPWRADAVADAMRAALSQSTTSHDRSRLADWVRENFSLEAVSGRVGDALEQRL
ncbi:glycosyltransferase family 4 protein [Arthrobacter sp. EH-1B-1]|uniref:D-inositol 3-phosphate glycosyltransferase n=1 Tax=Arthrobacter vasquezii TaxID=2977629 RepID=A0ABT6CUT7_9MICC|nr:glycosyltransferase family 4 protein [Arthrobacter vasquezii]MDF9277849.1 glycosyltransferase family 4 protein [Arthrobacter vasquezii]